MKEGCSGKLQMNTLIFLGKNSDGHEQTQTRMLLSDMNEFVHCAEEIPPYMAAYLSEVFSELHYIRRAVVKVGKYN